MYRPQLSFAVAAYAQTPSGQSFVHPEPSSVQPSHLEKLCNAGNNVIQSGKDYLSGSLRFLEGAYDIFNGIFYAKLHGTNKRKGNKEKKFDARDQQNIYKSRRDEIEMNKAQKREKKGRSND